MENYKTYDNIDGYRFFENGSVYRENTRINGYINDNGYLTFTDRNNKKKQIHRIIAELFVDNPNKYKFIIHIDKNKLNNHFTNLKWVSQQPNAKSSIQYNIELLNICLSEKRFSIEHDIPEKVTGETKLSIKCVICNEPYERTFKSIYSVGQFCNVCCKNNAVEKREKHFMDNHGVKNCSQLTEIKDKKKKTCLETLGVENPGQSKEVKDKIKKTNLERRGVECSLQSEDVKEKSKQTNLEKRGVEYASKSKEVKDKIKKTNLERRGVECSLQSEDVKEKSKQTNMERRGVEYALQSQEVKEKSKITNLERRGVEYPSQSKEVQDKNKQTSQKKFGTDHPMQSDTMKEKFKQTCLNNHGVEHPSQLQSVKDKKIQTSLKNFGVEHPAQNPEVADKSSNNAYKKKPYIFPSGRIDMVQGTEPLALDELLNIEKINENDIITQRSKVPICWWTDDNGKKHRYFVDIFIPSQNRCIESKSTWTSKKKEDCIFIKQKALQEAGYICEIWVYGKKNKKVECYK